MEKILAKTFSYLFHPLLITSLGMLVLFNSGTSLSVLQFEVKKVALIVTMLFTLVFPLLMIIILYLTRMIHNITLKEREERTLPLALTIILYLFTFFIMRGIPQLTGTHIVFLFCPPAALFATLVINRYMKPSIHMLGIGILLGELLVLILLYGAALHLFFITAILIGGILGSSRLILQADKPGEILAGFSTGFLVTVIIMTSYAL
ncbi:MAG: hypothetical protein WD052_05345 [Bacteroidales bacterium]